MGPLDPRPPTPVSCGFTTLGAIILSLGTGVMASGEAKRHPAVTFHAPPKPLSEGALTEDWPSFLGPTRNGVCRETGLLKQWPEGGPALVWEMEKGSGYSSPSIAGQKLVLFHRQGGREIVECLHTDTGQLYWAFAYGSEYRDRYGYSNGPRASPVIDEGRVYTIGAEGKLHCLSLETGQEIWMRDIFQETSLEQNFFGVASTPLVEGDLLIVNVGAPGGPCVAAFHKTTGRIVWESGDQWGASYASPVPAVVHGRRRLFVLTGGASRPPTGGLLCIDPVDGHIDWRFPWRSKRYESANASSPVIVGNRVFISASYGTGGALLRIKPDLTFDVAWMSHDLATHWNTAVHKEGHLYGFDGRHRADAALVCLNIETGEQVWRFAPEWQEQYRAHGRQQASSFSTYRGTLLAADGLFLCLGEMGHLLWLSLTPKDHRVVSRAWLFAAPDTWTPPVICRGLLYVVQNRPDLVSGAPPRFLCYDLRGMATPSPE